MSGGLNAPFGLSPYQSLVGNGDITKLQTFKIDPGCQSIYAGDPVVMAGSYNPVANDPVVGAPGTIVPLSALPAPAQAIAPILGYLTSVKYQSPTNIYSNSYPFWSAGTQVAPNTEIIGYVNIDPNVILQVQVSTSQAAFAGTVFLNQWIGITGSLAVGGVAINNNVPAGYTVTQNPASGNNSVGTSAYYLDGSTLITNAAISTTANLALTVQANFKVLGIVEPQNFSNIGAANVANAQYLANKIPGIDMPFVTVYGKFNNHIYSQGTLSNMIVQRTG